MVQQKPEGADRSPVGAVAPGSPQGALTRGLPTLPALLVLGFAVSSIGGPLALVSMVPGAAGGSTRSLGFVTLVGGLLFVGPILVWARYSERIATAGGLYSFVEAALGTGMARVQGAIWTLSYFLYLSYTVTYVVYDQLPVVLPGISPVRPLLEAVLPLCFCAAVFLPARTLLRGFVGAAVIQIGLMVALAALLIGRGGFPLSSLVPSGDAGGLASGGAAVSLLFVCASLPLFLGGEIAGGSRAMRSTLLRSVAIVFVVLLFVTVPLARAGSGTLAAEMPGYAIARDLGPRPFAVAVGLATAGSAAMLILAEFVALGRLLHAMLGRPVRLMLAFVSVVFVALTLVSLANPSRFYQDLAPPSLDALFLSQIIVFVGYPRFRLRHGRLTVLDVVAATMASALMAYGLYTAVAGQIAT